MKLSETQLQKNTEIVQKLIKGFPGNVREQVDNMMDNIGEEFFLAPASSREEHHACYPGGLCEHSLRVVKNFRTIAEALAPGKYTNSQLDFLALFHDLGKVGDVGKPYYLLNPSDWHRNKGMLYVTNTDLPFMPTCDRTLYLLQSFGITLDNEEWLAIKLHDGMHEDVNRKYSMKEPDLAVLLHFADRWATQVEKVTP